MTQQLLLELGIKAEALPSVGERIAAGEKFLDERLGPGWRLRADAETLDIESPYNCLLAHLFNHFLVGCYELGIGPYEAIRLGFNVLDPDSSTAGRELEALTRLWRKVITA